MEITSPPKYSNSKLPFFPPTTEAERGLQIARASKPTDEQGRYWHWDKLRNLAPPQGWSAEEWWAGMKWARKQKNRNLPFVGKNGSSFMLLIPGCAQAQLHWIENSLAGNFQARKPFLNSIDRHAFLAKAQMKEALSSSQLDGVDVSRERAEEILGQRGEPRNLDEWTVYNNYRATRYVSDNVDQDLSPEMIMELHRIFSWNPLVESAAAGRFRTETDEACFSEKAPDMAWHVPPAAQEIEERIFRLCSFANHPLETADSMHRLVRSILIHLIFIYDHPFADANRKMARALFYWSMLKNGYELAEFLSISNVLTAIPGQYQRSFRYVVTDDNDATYFIIHQLDVIIKAIQNLWVCLEGKND